MLQLFSPNGRIGRGTWWLIALIPIVIFALVSFGLAIPSLSGVATILIVPLVLAMFWVTICANIRRYHDLGKSGWWVFVGLIPLIGGIWQLIELGMIAGDDGENRFGAPASSGSETSLSTYQSGKEISGSSGVDLSKFDAQYFKERAEKMSAQPRTGISAVSISTASRISSGPVVFGKR